MQNEQPAKAVNVKELRAIRSQLADLLARLDRLLPADADVAKAQAPPPAASAASGPSAPPPIPSSPASAPTPSPAPAASPQPQKADSTATGPGASTPKAGVSAAEDLGGVPLKDAVVAVVKEAGNPITVDAICKRLEERKAKLPAEKPKLAVRKILFNKSLFTVSRGAYVLKD